METSKCPKCGSTRDIYAGFEIARFYCGSAAKAGEEGLYWEGEECRRRQEVNGLRAELARLKSEKEAAERERDEAKATADLYQVELRLAGEQQLSRSEEYSRQLTAVTSRAEALERERGARADAVSEIIDCLRCVLLQPGNADYEQDARAAIKEYLALLQPAKEVEGGK